MWSGRLRVLLALVSLALAGVAGVFVIVLVAPWP